jgi:hypothetical protein
MNTHTLPIDECPPPAYEFCEQEFQNKLSMAIHVSSSSSLPNLSSHAAEEEWEDWNEALFQENSRRLADHPNLSESSRSGASVQQQDHRCQAVDVVSPSSPLADKLQSGKLDASYNTLGSTLSPKTASGSGNSRGFSAGPPNSILQARALPSIPGSQSSLQTLNLPTFSAIGQESGFDNNQAQDIPPPPFTAIHGVRQENVVVLTYNQDDNEPSSSTVAPGPSIQRFGTPSSPSCSQRESSHGGETSATHSHARASSVASSSSGSINSASRVRGAFSAANCISVDDSPRRSSGASSKPYTPRINFDPSIAYAWPENHRSKICSIPTADPPAPVEPASFYNSAVQSFINPVAELNSTKPPSYLPRYPNSPVSSDPTSSAHRGSRW